MFIISVQHIILLRLEGRVYPKGLYVVTLILYSSRMTFLHPQKNSGSISLNHHLISLYYFSIWGKKVSFSLIFPFIFHKWKNKIKYRFERMWANIDSIFIVGWIISLWAFPIARQLGYSPNKYPNIKVKKAFRKSIENAILSCIHINILDHTIWFWLVSCRIMQWSIFCNDLYLSIYCTYLHVSPITPQSLSLHTI